MKITFEKKIDRDEVLSTMECYKNSPNYPHYCKLYNEVIEESLMDINPEGYYIIKENDNYIDNKYEEVIFCIITLGNNINQKIKHYFHNNNYLKGMLLNTIGDIILFNMSTSMYELLSKEQNSKGINLSSRIEPGSIEYDIKFQKTILDLINEEENTNIKITSGYMLYPSKSLSYCYGASKSIPCTHIDHDCSMCSNVTCNYRKVMLTIKDKNNSYTINVKSGTNLLTALRDNNIPINAYCNGQKTCGKCKVKVISSNLELSVDEKRLLTEKEINDNTVLACFHNLYENTIVEIISSDTISKIETNYIFPTVNSPKYRIISVNNIIENNKLHQSVVELINKKLCANYNYSLNSLKQLSLINNYTSSITLLSNNNKDILKVSNDNIQAYGIGIDIGTTTIAIVLIDLINMKQIDIYKYENPQKAYGADIITRINYAINDDKNILTDLILNEISQGIISLLNKSNISTENVTEVAIGGNTTMLYLLTRLNPYQLSISPFITVDLSMKEYEYYKLFNDRLLDCKVTLLPGISAYIGADIISGLYYCDLVNQNENILFIDIGTNGEMALKCNNRIICASTAAGPAFEGANIKCGMPSINGAIINVEYTNNEFTYDVIGNISPKGICGSALIDIASILLDNNMIDTTGKMNDKKCIIYTDEHSEIAIYQEDIRQLQLAKSAISAGISVLINEANINVSDIDKVYIAGGFGSNLNISNATAIGIIPRELENKVKLLGNSSLGGCVKYLLNANSYDDFDLIKSRCEYIELATSVKFNEDYIRDMFFS
ncbi:MAG: ASKHA domain-containing protein [Vallitalea sp.]|jgi:uncharacterized 2Fe-2S/4Fe-4S cluster protein (DUF4445 family)|nr:ASKHA domain-containing protein [Vallitalea sp.]